MLNRKLYLVTRLLMFDKRAPPDINNSHAERKYSLELFKKTCFPSIISQVNLNFEWIILTSNIEIDNISEIVKKIPVISHVIGCDSFNYPLLGNEEKRQLLNKIGYYTANRALMAFIKSRHCKGDFVQTGFMDADDIISIDFTDNILKIEPEDNIYINFINGMMYGIKEHKLIKFNSPFSTFMVYGAYVRDFFYTVFSRIHYRVPLRNIISYDKTLWCQIIHEHNINSKLTNIPEDNMDLTDDVKGRFPVLIKLMDDKNVC